MDKLIRKINQGKYDTEQQLSSLRKNALRLGRKDVLRAVNKRLKQCYPKVYLRDVVGNGKKNTSCNHKKSLKNMNSSERVRYMNTLFGREKEYSTDVFDRGIVVSGGAFGMS